VAEVEFTAQAENDLSKLDRSTAQRVLKKLRWFADNFDVVSHEPLSGTWHGVYKLRIGDYRALYTFDLYGENITVTVHFVRHRREVYKLG
jgi:mRNA interferase RelE/StbE